MRKKRRIWKESYVKAAENSHEKLSRKRKVQVMESTVEIQGWQPSASAANRRSSGVAKNELNLENRKGGPHGG